MPTRRDYRYELAEAEESLCYWHQMVDRTLRERQEAQDQVDRWQARVTRLAAKVTP